MADGGPGKGILTLHGESKHTKKHFKNSCYHCNLPLLYFNIHYYSIEGQDLRVQIDGRRWFVDRLGGERR